MEVELEDDARAVARFVGSVVSLAAGLAGFAMLVVTFSWAFGFILLAGGGLLMTRVVFFWTAPFMLRHAPIIVGYLNDIVITALDVVIDAVVLAINVLRSADPFYHGGDIPWADLAKVSVAEFEAALREAMQTCVKVDSLGTMWSFAVTPTVSGAACPLVRAAYPVADRIGLDMSPLNGVVTYDPRPDGNNCAPQGEFAGSSAPVGLCIGLASGYVVIEVVLPLLIGGLFCLACASAIRHMAWDAATLVLAVCEQCVRTAIAVGGVVGVFLRTLVGARGEH